MNKFWETNLLWLEFAIEFEPSSLILWICQSEKEVDRLIRVVFYTFPSKLVSWIQLSLPRSEGKKVNMKKRRDLSLSYYNPTTYEHFYVLCTSKTLNKWIDDSFTTLLVSRNKKDLKAYLKLAPDTMMHWRGLARLSGKREHSISLGQVNRPINWLWTTENVLAVTGWTAE